MRRTLREVPARDWGAFCERVNQFEGGAVFSLETEDRNGAKQQLADKVPFDSMDFGKRDECNDRFAIRSRGNGRTKYEVVEPIHVMLKESTECGAGFQSVIIEAENGLTTLTFHPTIKMSWLENLELL
ncbi:MAG TPA: hypothetical protein VFM25_05640 [Verrucomicrobiae bacterium]|nr:hypothetical protein [Verrucomicrobiae bacterium]